jgi:hypothetical protein
LERNGAQAVPKTDKRIIEIFVPQGLSSPKSEIFDGSPRTENRATVSKRERF